MTAAGRRRLRRPLLAGAGALVLAVAAGSAWLREPFCFLNRARDVDLPLCSAPATAWSRLHVAEAGLDVHVVQPRRPAAATLVLVPGLHPQGVHDPRFRNFAESCAEAGFQVLAPDVVDFRTFQVDGRVVESLSHLVEALPRHLPPASLGNVGLFGISYAGGPVLMAAARPEVARHLHFVGAFGGYYDVVHAVEYALSGQHPSEGRLPPPHQWGRMIFVAQYAELFLPAGEAGVLREALLLRLRLRVDEARQREEALSEPARAMLQSVLDGPPPHDVERFRRVIPRYEDLSRALSPAFVLARLDPRLRVYLIHGQGDDVIPYTETVEIERALRDARHPHVRALITRAFRHMDPRQSGLGPLEELREVLRLMRWTRAFLAEAG